MSIREGLTRVLSEYQHARTETFAEHQLADVLRNKLKNAVKQASGESGRLKFKGSAGQSKWARGPWIGIFDPVVTTSAQVGYYASYLFREDMQGVYLSLNQAMTEAKEHYQADAKTALRARAENFRALLGDRIKRFPQLTIDLAPGSPANDTAFYEAGNICAKFYPANAVPDEAVLVGDLKDMLRLYEALILSQTASDLSVDSENDAPPDLDFEDATRFRLHKRIERNAKLIKKVKKIKGYTCEVCGLNFEKRYGPIGAGYIEAHHLKPLASLQGTKVAMDPELDFAVLCANCHRMVHRSGLVDDIHGFKREHLND